MRYPNLRYGNPTEFAHYAMGIPLPVLARKLRRDERTVRDWLSAKTRVPWWVPEILRLKHMEGAERSRQMGCVQVDAKLGIVRGEVIELIQRPETKKPQLTELRLEQFSEPRAAVG